MRILMTGDFELTESRLELYKCIFDEITVLAVTQNVDYVLIGGDVFREYTEKTTSVLSDFIAWLHGQGIKTNILLGNHDYYQGEEGLKVFDRLEGVENIIRWPVLWPSAGLALLPAPNRARFGAGKGAQGKRERNEAISTAINAAAMKLINDADNPEDFTLVYHAALAEMTFGNSPLAKELTWTLSTEVADRFKAGVGFHIHKPINPQDHELGAYWVCGAPIPDTHGVKADRFRVLIHDSESGIMDSIPLSAALYMPKIAAHGRSMTLGEYSIDYTPDMVTDSISKLLTEAGYMTGNPLDVKITAELDRADYELWPSQKEIAGSIAPALRVRLKKSVIAEQEARLDVDMTGDSKDFSGIRLADLITRAASVFEIADKAALDKALEVMEYEGFDKWAEAGNLGFRPIELKLKNFRQWPDVELGPDVFGDGKVAIVGDNALGKSNLMEAIAVALYRKSPKFDGITNEIRRGETSGSIILMFESGKKIYEVRRVYEMSGSGKVSCNSELIDLEAGEPIAETTNDIDSFIAERIGGYYYFLSTCFGAQGTGADILTATPAQLEEIFVQAFNLEVFESYRARCAKELSEIEKELGRYQTIAEEAEKELSELTDKPDVDIEDLQEMRKVTKHKRDKAQAEINQLDKKLEKLASEHAKTESAMEAIERAQKKLAEKKAEKKNLKGDLKTAKAEMAEAQAKLNIINSDPGFMPPEQMDIDRICSDERKAKQKLEKLNKQKQGIEDRIRGFKRDIKGYQEDIQRANKSLGMYKSRLETAKELEKDTKAAVPCNANLYMKCPLFKSADGSKTVAETEAEIKNTRESIQRREEMTADLCKDMTAAKSELYQVGEQIQPLEDSIKAIEEQAEKAREYERRSDKLKSATSRHDILSKQLSSINKDIEEAENSVIASRTVIQRPISEIQLDRKTARRDREEFQRLVKEYNASIAELSADIKLAIERKEQIDKQREKLKIVAREKEKLHATRAGYTILEKLFHRSGIPHLLIERAVPEVERVANELLADTELSLEVRAQKKTQAGEYKDNIEIFYCNYRGEFGTKSASGYEKSPLSMALRLAIARVGNDIWGRPPEFLVQDEGFGAFHKSRMDIARAIINRMAELVSTFVFITHRGILAAEADILIEVEEEGKYKVVQQ